MGVDWIRFCRARNFLVEAPDVDVILPDGRRHRVTVEEKENSYLINAIVIKKRMANQINDLAIQTWIRNRVTSIVGFRVDTKGRLLAEAWVPKLGLSKEEFQFYLNTLAMEADRFEYELTGEDVE